ncbi:S24 family peptidase [Pseudogemmobacter bohemicus]|uniref:S24 family peptidase n=1 Tax=Pseudogemmobacter bohemicus TaxID=2250708 RepID=UPI00130077F8|nr:S24 family peptidase [Pseudogemmobacter bohemicus]
MRAAAERIGGLDALSERLTDVFRHTLTDWASDKTEPRASSIAEICELTGATYEWLLAGEKITDPTMGSAGFLVTASEAIQATKSDEALIALPFYEDVAASAGHGAMAGYERSDAIIAFARKFLLSKGAAPENCTIIRATGDSMQPNIPDGSLLVIDHGQTEARNGHIMVINPGDDLL